MADSEPSKPEMSKKLMSKFGLPRQHRQVDISPDSCLVPEAKLLNTPSQRDSMDELTEKALRYVGCELIQSMAILLKLPQVAAATGQVLYQRYYYSKSFVRNPFEHTAMACVCLASKIEEAPRRPRDIINVYNHLRQLDRFREQILKGKRSSNMALPAGDRNESFDWLIDKMVRWNIISTVIFAPTPKILPLDQHYINLKNNVIKAERRVLKELGFCVHVKHPHKLITAYMKALDCVEVPTMIQKAWNYMNDGLRTDMFTRYSPETIACACIFLAARVCQVPLPLEPRPWWELFDAQQEAIEHISKMLLSLYARSKPPSWRKLEERVNKLKEKLSEKQKEARLGLEGTPRDTQKFSPSHNDTPVKDKDREKLKDKNAKAVNGTAEGRQRKRSLSSESHSPPSARRKYTKKYRDDITNRGFVKKHSRKRDRSRSRSPIRISSIDTMLSKKRSKKRDKSRSRERSHKRTEKDKVRKDKEREQKEREVRMELGKRRRDISPPSPERKKFR